MTATPSGVQPFGDSIIHSGPVDFTQPINYSNIKGKTIVITGGASGFGAACFAEWARHGANVVIGDINEQAGRTLVARIRQQTNNSNHHFIGLDVTSWASQAAFFKQAASLSPHGGIDHVMANAGVAVASENEFFEEPPDYSTMENPPPPMQKTVDINLDGVLLTTHLALAYLSRNPHSQRVKVGQHTGERDRHLILVASIAGLTGLATLPYYAAAKHGVVGLWRTLRMTTPIKHGIRVNMINPYFVDTPLLGGAGNLVMAGGAMAEKKDVIEAVTRLVADQGIIGRGLCIGPKAAPGIAEQAGLSPAVANQAIWDAYAEDFEQTDIFTRRLIGVTNLLMTTRGWAGVWVDVGSTLKKGLWGVFGY